MHLKCSTFADSLLNLAKKGLSPRKTLSPDEPAETLMLLRSHSSGSPAEQFIGTSIPGSRC